MTIFFRDLPCGSYFILEINIVEESGPNNSGARIKPDLKTQFRHSIKGRTVILHQGELLPIRD